MMAYITTAKLSARLGSSVYARLTDRVNGTAADANVAQQIVDEAEAEANSYLALRYATPVDVAAHPELADVLEARVLDLAEAAAWRGSPFVAEPPGRVKEVYDAATRWFQSVAAGELNLPAARPIEGPTAADDSPRYSESARRFTAEELNGL